PVGVAVGPDGSVYVADRINLTVRKVAPNGVITTLAGTGAYGFDGDGGPATAARLAAPEGVAVGPDGSVYIADSGNGRVRRVAPGGIITTVAGGGAGGLAALGDGLPATAAQLLNPLGVAVAPDGRLYIADYENSRVRTVSPGGTMST